VPVAKATALVGGISLALFADPLNVIGASAGTLPKSLTLGLSW
jgi:hypothetical protein